MMKTRRRGWSDGQKVRRLVGFDDSIMMMRDGIPGLSVVVLLFFFAFLLSFLSFVLSFPFSCTHLGGEKRFHGVYTLTREM